MGPQRVTGKGGAGYKTQREASGEDLHLGMCPSTEGHMPPGDPEDEEPQRSPWPPVTNAPGPLPPPPSPNQGRWRAGRDELAEAMSARAFPSASYTPLGTSGP